MDKIKWESHWKSSAYLAGRPGWVQVGAIPKGYQQTQAGEGLQEGYQKRAPGTQAGKGLQKTQAKASAPCIPGFVIASSRTRRSAFIHVFSALPAIFAADAVTAGCARINPAGADLEGIGLSRSRKRDHAASHSAQHRASVQLEEGCFHKFRWR